MCSTPPTLKVVFTLSISTITDEKKKKYNLNDFSNFKSLDLPFFRIQTKNCNDQRHRPQLYIIHSLIFSINFFQFFLTRVTLHTTNRFTQFLHLCSTPRQPIYTLSQFHRTTLQSQRFPQFRFTFSHSNGNCNDQRQLRNVKSLVSPRFVHQRNAKTRYKPEFMSSREVKAKRQEFSDNRWKSWPGSWFTVEARSVS